ncbi:sn-glycerol-3-phosphate import ATP-binding protein UgpC [uncultured spirochete]|jgi:multiple sugar transport system ATP-binding protein|uniref:sn-glycerol-3-phosphate import ATP-binding protein UgpC n=1 Tax=uncultured spirochete TaxID=156406 RepID=A0A3P3XKD2_9SPIR|nr:sn-glycerol-3-phosphate import ATP-binding protein UgpC [uncultured spirochete]
MVSYLKLNSLKKTYPNGVTAVKDIDLEIEKGEFVVILGPSGCGKTTTLRMLAGLEEVTNGSIILDGRDITHLPPRQRDISMIFQSYAVWPHMTVAENIAYPLKLRKMDKHTIHSKVQEVARICNILDYLNRYPAQLSGGQRQRVAVARALAVDSKLSLMDEPLSNLDAKLRTSVRTFLKEIHRNTGATTIFVTHDQAEAMALADRIVVMNEGKIEQVGSTREIYNQCGSLFTAQFMGTPPANIQKVSLISNQGRLIANDKNAETQFSLDLGNQSAFPGIDRYIGEEIFLAIRPENINISKPKGINETSIEIVEPQGAYTILVTKVFGSEWKIMLEGDIDIRIGQKVSLIIDPGKIMLFDAQSKKRVNFS